MLQSNEPSFGLLFDIDGVIVRGKKVLPKVPETFKKLINSEGNFRVPTVFLTNAGNGLTQEKAQQLSDWLQIKVRRQYNFWCKYEISVFIVFRYDLEFFGYLYGNNQINNLNGINK